MQIQATMGMQCKVSCQLDSDLNDDTLDDNLEDNVLEPVNTAYQAGEDGQCNAAPNPLKDDIDSAPNRLQYR